MALPDETAQRPPPPPALRTSRLSLEQLESRENPADNIWKAGLLPGGIPPDFTIGTNWSLGHMPISNETIVVRAAGPGQDGSTQDLTFPTWAALYAGIRIDSGYLGTVKFQSNIEFGTYTQTGGKVDQITVSLTTTVTSTFSWTGGSIDPVSTGDYLLKGVFGGRIGDDASVLTTGARFTLDKQGAMNSDVKQSGKLALRQGTLAEIVVKDADFTQTKFNPRALVAPQISTGVTDPENPPADNPGVRLTTAGAIFRSEGGTVPSVLISKGQMVVSPGGLTVTGKVPNSAYGVKMTDGTLSIVRGETLTATNGVLMDDGLLRAQVSNQPGATQTATIAGTFTMNNGIIQVSDPPIGQNPVKYGKLLITKQADLWGGLFKANVDATDDGTRDIIQTMEKFDCTVTCQVDVTEWGGSANSGTGWCLLMSQDGFNNGVLPKMANASYAWDTPVDKNLFAKKK